MDTLGNRLREISPGHRVHPSAHRPVVLWALLVVAYAAAMLTAAHLWGAITVPVVAIVLIASAGLLFHLFARHRVATWPESCRACRAMSGGGARNLCRHHEDVRPVVLIVSAMAACVPVVLAIAMAAPMLLLASPIGIVLGYAAARVRGFSVVGGVIAGSLMGPLALVLFLVEGKRA